MKKALLSIIAAAACGFSLAAEEVTFDFTANAYGMTAVDSNTKDDAATADVNEEYPDAGKTFSFEGVSITLGERARYWSASANTFRVNNGSEFTVAVDGTITSIKFDGGSNLAYFSTDATPAYDAATTTWIGSASEVVFKNVGANNKTGTVQIKKMIVTFTPGVVDTRADAALSFSENACTAILGEPFTAPTFTKATTAAVVFSSSNEEVATVDATTGAVTILAEGKTTIKAEAEANDDYRAGAASYVLTVLNVVAYEKATELVDGKSYLIVYGTKVATPLSSNYGYLKAATAYEAEGGILAEEANEFTFKAVAGTDNYNIMAADYFYYMTGTYNSFNRATEEPADGAEWAVVINADGTAAITNAAMSKTMYFDETYGSFGAYAEQAETQKLPTLYVKKGASGIEAIDAVDSVAAPVEYFNLQGIRVAEPARGLYIMRQGNKASKVYIR